MSNLFGSMVIVIGLIAVFGFFMKSADEDRVSNLLRLAAVAALMTIAAVIQEHK